MNPELEQFLIRRAKVYESWVTLQSFPAILMIVAAYLYFALKLGPQLMKNREPFELKTVLFVYNAFQVVYNLWQLIMLDITTSLPYLYNTCHSIYDDRYQKYLLEMCWWFLINKIIDLLDTVFIVLRKKNNQINFLHVYHHSTTVLLGYIHIVVGPGEHVVICWYMNSLIHCIMYFYYFVASLGPQYQKYLWWKKYLTGLQTVQFVILLGYLTWIALTCNFPFTMVLPFYVNVIALLVLFSKFYVKNYSKKHRNTL